LPRERARTGRAGCGRVTLRVAATDAIPRSVRSGEEMDRRWAARLKFRSRWQDTAQWYNTRLKQVIFAYPTYGSDIRFMM